ncbi:hypothetical protein AM274_01170 [Pseudomonas nunensis]|nr:hypothetical protein AM274_01170 [Pseudomonas nunensis]
MAVKQLFETYVYAQILSSADLLPFVIIACAQPPRSRAPPSKRQQAMQERLVEGEGLTQKNAAKIRGVGVAGSAIDQA